MKINELVKILRKNRFYMRDGNKRKTYYSYPLEGFKMERISYSIPKKERDKAKFFEFKGWPPYTRKVSVFIFDYNHRSYPGKILADNYYAFDKWDRCPLMLDFPSNDEEVNFLLKKLKWLGTKEACQWSRQFPEDLIVNYKD